MASDLELLLRSQQGDKEAFNALVGKYRAGVYRVAYGMLLNESDAEDVAQEAFLRAFRSIRRCDPAKGFAPWLYGIALNRCRSRVRARQAAKAADRDGYFAANSRQEIADPAVSSQVREEVRRALSRLPERQRAALALFHIEGFKVAEIAKTMKCSVGTVKAHLHKARANLRRFLSHIVEEE